jgi:hypothetical protein
VVAVLALIGKAFLEPSSEKGSSSTLGLSQSSCGLTQVVWVSHLLASREREEGTKAGINAYGSIRSVGNTVRLRVDEQAEIPPRRPLDEPSACDPALGKVLGMETDMPYAWEVNASHWAL